MDRTARRSGRFVALAVTAVLAVTACGSGLSEDELFYCQNVAPPEELDAAAQQLNIQPDADRTWEDIDPTDPVYVQVCEYAHGNRNGSGVQPGVGVPAEPSPTAPLGPGANDPSFIATPVPTAS